MHSFLSLPGVTSDGYLRADGHPTSSQDYEEHLYVNTLNLNNTRPSSDAQEERSPESPKKDIFDMSMSDPKPQSNLMSIT